MLFLMNRDEIIAVFEKKDSSYLLLGNKKEKMPIGFQTLENWLKRRNSASHNGYLYSLAGEQAAFRRCFAVQFGQLIGNGIPADFLRQFGGQNLRVRFQPYVPRAGFALFV